MILVVGANGMLGRDLMLALGEKGRGVDLPDIDITNINSVRQVLTALAPAVVINCAAYTNVDGCETEQATAFAVNADGVGVLADVTADLGATLVHISTDYVFNGQKGSPYLEDDPIDPMSIYGKSKAAGEENARRNPKHLIVRTQWLYGYHGNNFVETMIRLGTERKELSVVDDQLGSPTWTVDLVKALLALVEAGCTGTYHAAGSGFCSWRGFAMAIFAAEGMDVTVTPISTEQLGRPAPRPLFSVLDCGKIARDAGVTMPQWNVSLNNYLAGRMK